MLFYLLFIIYLSLGCWLVPKLRFVKQSGLPAHILRLLFLAKMAAGVLIGWMSQRFYPGNDYWTMNREGFGEYHILITEPRVFFSSLFHSVYDHYNGFFDSVGSYWNDLKNNLIIKVIAVFDIFSRGNYYINSLFFNTISFIGLAALFRVFDHIIPGRKRLIMLGVFLVPSTLYFASGIYKDLVVCTALCFYSYALYFGLNERFHVRRILLLSMAFLVILLIRNYVAMLILPLSLVFFISNRKPEKSVRIMGAGLVLMLLLAWLLSFIHPSLNILHVIVQKQQDFAALPHAASQLSMSKLEPTAGSFLHNLPQAVNHGFLRPFIWDSSSPFLLPMALELLGIQLLMIACIFFPGTDARLKQPFILYCFCTGIILILLTGYIIPNLGSIIRYRSIYLPFLLPPLLCLPDWESIRRKIRINF